MPQIAPPSSPPSLARSATVSSASHHVSGWRVYGHYLSISIRSQLQYRTNFIIQSVAHFLITGIEFLGLAALFQRFSRIEGWTLAEVGLFYGIISLSFTLAEAVPRGFDIFPRLIKSGDFDRMLLRPRTTVLQILGSGCQLIRIGRLTQALIILIWSVHTLAIAWTPSHLTLLLMAITGGACLFSGLFVLSATLAFWTTESLEIINCTTYGGIEAAQFPLTIYRPWFRRIFTFVIPLATINYFPIHALLGRTDPLGSTPLWQCLTPLAGVAFLGFTLLLFILGTRHYTSTGN